MLSEKFNNEEIHIEVVLTLCGMGKTPFLIQWRDGKEECVSKKNWEIIKQKHNWTTDF